MSAVRCVVFAILVLAWPGWAATGTLTIVFGPASTDAARQSARAAASAARLWVKSHGSEVRLLGPGSTEPVQLGVTAQLEQTLEQAALAAREADPATFLAALDAAVQSTALLPGARLVVAALNGPPLSSAAERRLDQLVEVARAAPLRVFLLDIIPPGSKTPPSPAMEAFARRTGGLTLRQGSKLAENLGVITAAAAPVAAAAAESKPSSQFPIPIYARVLRTSNSGSVSSGSVAHMGGETGSARTNYTTAERDRTANDATGPLRGVLMVEIPLNALRFDTKTIPANYLARARLDVKVVNNKSVTVWSARHDYDLRGPLAKLEDRQKGTLAFLRSVTLPAGEYSIRASVEDLISEDSGLFEGPIRPETSVPGLSASDAVFVRRFLRASDRFEADQIFAYDGEALTPRLRPVFDSAAPVDLQIFFTLYPDTQGVQPDLSMELLRNGKSVARLPLPFDIKIHDMSREGKFGTMPGTSSILGGKAQEFPYLALMKGARLVPGSYQSVITIRQGRNVITRSASFLVTGPEPVETAGGSVAAAPEAEDLSAIHLPEIEPVSLDSSGLAPSLAEQANIWQTAADNAASYSERLPNFRCIQEVRRLRAPAKTPDQLKPSDSFKDEITYENGKESYHTIEIDGVKVLDRPSDFMGVHSRGEFGSMLLGLFSRQAEARYKWAGRAMAMGVLCQVFEVEVDQATSNFTLTNDGRRERVGYTGKLFIDEESGLVRRFVMKGTGLPKDFALQSPAFSLEYGLVRIGTDDFLLPLRSTLQLRQLKHFVRNETVFGSYRRFEASSEVKFEQP